MRGRHKKKAKKAIKGEESCRAQEGRLSRMVSYCRIALGNGTAVTVWGRRIGLGPLKEL